MGVGIGVDVRILIFVLAFKIQSNFVYHLKSKRILLHLMFAVVIDKGTLADKRSLYT